MSEMADEPPRKTRAGRQQIGWALVRIVGAVTALLVVYFMFPLTDRDNVGIGLLAVLIGLAVFVVIFLRQMRRIRRAEFPLLRAAEAIVLVATLFIILMSTIAAAFSAADPANYSEPLSRLDAIYFTVTTWATVGFGDITPTAPATRAFTTIQIVIGVGLLGVGLRSLVTVAQEVSKGKSPAG